MPRMRPGGRRRSRPVREPVVCREFFGAEIHLASVDLLPQESNLGLRHRLVDVGVP